MSLGKQRFIRTIDGIDVKETDIESPDGSLAAIILGWGGVLKDLKVRLADGTMQRVVLGFEHLDDYIAHSPHFGAIAGRFANRIAQGKFSIDGVQYELPLNQEGKHSLHGGGHGFGKKPWTLLTADAGSCTLGLISPDGEAGYPGTLNVTCRYALTDTNALRIELSAFTNRPTIVNLCHHSYFNLDGGADILDHMLMVRANVMTPVDADMIPDGSLAPVSGRPFDFRKPRPVRFAGPNGKRFWYDHNFVLRRERQEQETSGLEIAHAATLASAKSGLSMEVWTSEPCLQVYDGAKLNVPVVGLGGVHYGANAGICLEPQHTPDSPNLPHTPSTVLRPEALYRQVTEYRFRPQPAANR